VSAVVFNSLTLACLKQGLMVTSVTKGGMVSYSGFTPGMNLTWGDIPHQHDQLEF
jgi:hypothetical protein